jgi:hypothetical protein
VKNHYLLGIAEVQRLLGERDLKSEQRKDVVLKEIIQLKSGGGTNDVG